MVTNERRPKYTELHIIQRLYRMKFTDNWLSELGHIVLLTQELDLYDDEYLIADYLAKSTSLYWTNHYLLDIKRHDLLTRFNHS